MTQVKRGRCTLRSLDPRPRQRSREQAAGPIPTAIPAPASQSLLLSSAHTLGQNANSQTCQQRSAPTAQPLRECVVGVNPPQQHGTAKASSGTVEGASAAVGSRQPSSSTLTAVPHSSPHLCPIPQSKNKAPTLSAAPASFAAPHWNTRGHQQAASSGHPSETKG